VPELGLKGLLSYFFSFQIYFEIDKYYPVWTGPDQAHPVQDYQSGGSVQSDLPVRPDRTEPYSRLGSSGLVESLDDVYLLRGLANIFPPRSPVHFRHPFISVYQSSLSPLASGVAVVVRNGFSRHTRPTGFSGWA
jgi:hypothetical protein